ncbi:FAD-dependent oxidoreductase [Glycomyces salinus]|uniref:FAD-dependent oxidoreductase n=1 Tax=Glycomyces salinus TaxID=980294 RepID=UPI0018EB6609|nr:NAD(P)/FAD-dependent oxidoreductase [Glycomyces salinus]
MQHRTRPQTKARTAVIIGGGVAGPVAAMALRMAGIEATVYEAHEPGSGSRGGPLSVAPNGRAALGLVGADDILTELATPTRRMVIRSYTGKILAEIPEPPGQAPRLTLPRGQLSAELQRLAAAEGIELVHGKRFVDATDTGRSVIARFDDHTTAEADVLIGCDGIRSAVRAVVDPRAPGPRYTGLVSFGGYVDGTGVPDTAGAQYFMFGRRAFFGYQVEGDECAWFANLPVKGLASGGLEATGYEHWIEALRTAFARDNGPALEILDRVTPEKFIPAHKLEDLPHTPVWSRGRAVLVGDAAHATSPSSGQGASLAAESAIELARCLRDLPIDQAFRAYHRNRRERVERIIAIAARTNQAKAAGPIAARIRDLVLPIIMGRFNTPERTAWQYDYRINWEEVA